ncbi:YrzI family small protein [Numidum massiliense]|uniref:YrzI family small protein n=1 Tax=Numidum massiliense TaxID=1522315 RepID=UPI00164CF2C4
MFTFHLLFFTVTISRREPAIDATRVQSAERIAHLMEEVSDRRAKHWHMFY